MESDVPIRVTREQRDALRLIAQEHRRSLKGELGIAIDRYLAELAKAKRTGKKLEE